MGRLTKQLRSSWTTGGSLESPANWLARTFGAPVSSAGESLTERDSMYVADFLTGVRIISETIAQLPLITYRTLERGKERARKHPLYGVLADAANPQMTAYDFRETLQAHLLTWGNAYAWIEWEGNDVIGLWPMLPDRTRCFRDPTGELYYETSIQKSKESSERRIYAEREVLHLHGLSFDGVRGYSVVDLMRESIGLSKAQATYHGRTLANNAMPPAIITQTQNMKPDDKARFMLEWRQAHQGPDKAWAIGMLAAGMDIKPLGVSQQDAQFLELRKFTRAQIMGFFRIPPHMVSDTESAPSGGTGVEARTLDFQKFAIQPWATRWEQQLNLKLLRRPRDQRYFAEFLMDGLLRGDALSRSTYFSQGFGKWLTADDIRSLDGFNPYKPPQDPEKNPGEVLLFPLNFGAAEHVAAEKPGPLSIPAGPGDLPGAAGQYAQRGHIAGGNPMRPEERALLVAIAKRLAEPPPPPPHPAPTQLVVPKDAFNISVSTPAPVVNFDRGSIYVEAPEQYDTQIVYDKKTGKVSGTRKVRA